MAKSQLGRVTKPLTNIVVAKRLLFFSKESWLKIVFDKQQKSKVISKSLF